MTRKTKRAPETKKSIPYGAEVVLKNASGEYLIGVNFVFGICQFGTYLEAKKSTCRYFSYDAPELIHAIEKYGVHKLTMERTYGELTGGR